MHQADGGTLVHTAGMGERLGLFVDKLHGLKDLSLLAARPRAFVSLCVSAPLFMGTRGCTTS